MKRGKKSFKGVFLSHIISKTVRQISKSCICCVIWGHFNNDDIFKGGDSLERAPISQSSPCFAEFHWDFLVGSPCYHCILWLLVLCHRASAPQSRVLVRTKKIVMQVQNSWLWKWKQILNPLWPLIIFSAVVEWALGAVGKDGHSGPKTAAQTLVSQLSWRKLWESNFKHNLNSLLWRCSYKHDVQRTKQQLALSNDI